MQNQDKGIVMSTQSLVLQKVGRMSRGEYECQAVNSEGTTTSNPVNLNIMCKKNIGTLICQTIQLDRCLFPNPI